MAFTGPGETSTNSNGKLTGTPHYMAPEQISGEGLGPHTDLYALGLVMAEALSGEPVYDPNLSIIKVLKRQMSPVPVPLSNKVLEASLSKIISKATEKPQESRYRLAASMLEDIEKLSFETPTFSTKRFIDYVAPSIQMGKGLEPELGTILNERWQLEEKLSARAFTLFYRATQLSLERNVAIKMLRPEATQKPNVVQHFKDEMRIVRQLDNPHTIRILDYGETDMGLPYMVMEWLKGLQLSRNAC